MFLSNTFVGPFIVFFFIKKRSFNFKELLLNVVWPSFKEKKRQEKVGPNKLLEYGQIPKGYFGSNLESTSHPTTSFQA
jgi:hypothetical protein